MNELNFVSGFRYCSLKYRGFQADGALRFEALLLPKPLCVYVFYTLMYITFTLETTSVAKKML